MTVKFNPYRPHYGQWRPYFAWLPKRCLCGRLRWLRIIDRRPVSWLLGSRWAYGYWEYRDVNN